MEADQCLLEVMLDCWDRNNVIMLNLLQAIPPGGLESKAMDNSPTVAQQFTHLHHERLISVFEEAPEFALAVPEREWADERDRDRLAEMLIASAQAVREAVKGRVLAGRDLDLHFDHPLLMLQLLLWHEGYHHGQIKLALKLSGHPVSNDAAGPATWDIWRRKTRTR